MPEINIRQATASDAPAAGLICYQAFHDINTAHNFPPDIPTPEAGVNLLTMMFSHPGVYCVVAEAGGRIIGSNCLDERSPIAGIGPITVETSAQNAGAGRKLMEAVIERSQARKFMGVRLLQAAFHNRSLSLYTKLGFDTREPISTMSGPAIRKTIDGFHVRPACKADLEACNRLSRKIHGHDRGGELADASDQGTAKVVERAGRITGYSSSMAFFGHSMGETVEDLKALISTADSFGGPGILVPTRNAALFRWCLENGLRVVHPMTLMSMGIYQEPTGSYLPSILY
ncbi:MAG: GNAT family N-acetyltransferase [Acidobacteriota bacterium]|nr:GNAT family N-acetyltransferase [Acidobacteriota bacterium]